MPPRLHKQGVFKRPWLPFGEYLASKQKGGEAYAKPPGRNYVWPRETDSGGMQLASDLGFSLDSLHNFDFTVNICPPQAS